MRPMNENESARGDNSCLNADSENMLVISQKFKLINAEAHRKVINSTTFSVQMITKQNVIRNAMSLNSSTQPSKAIVQLYSLMDKQAQARPTPWLAKSRSSNEKSIDKMIEKALFLELYSSCGEKLNNKKIAIQSKLALPRSTTNRSKTYSIYLQEFCIAAGILPMASSYKI